MLKIFICTGLFLCVSLLVSGQPEYNKSYSNRHITDSSLKTYGDQDTSYDALLSQWGDDVKYSTDCQTINDEMAYIPDSVYISRLAALPTRMEMAYNPLVRQMIETYANKRRRQVSTMLSEGKYFFPIFEEALDKEGLPIELKYLPVIESALKPVARSRVGATGLWQFMAPTGKMYNLEINSLVDERSDPQKSSAAAVKYLKDLYGIYGDWNLVIAAYNCGPGNVNKAIRRSGGQADYWAIYAHLPRETRNYVPIFIAATYIMNYHAEHNICPADESKYPPSLDTLMINKNIHFQQISEVLDISIEDIRTYNPQFKNDIIPGEYKSYNLNLPISQLTAFLDNQETIVNHKKDELLTRGKMSGANLAKGGNGSITHRVKKGDTLGKIAKRYGVTIAQIKKWNKLKANSAPVGRRLTIYSAPTTPKKKADASDVQLASNTTSNNTTSNNSGEASASSDIVVNEVRHNAPYTIKTSTEVKQVTTTGSYKIKSGDTWAGIARKNGATVAQMKAWNKTNKLIAGKQLKVLKTKNVEVTVQDTVRLAEPQLAFIELDSTYSNDLIDGYLKKIDRDESTLPLIRIGAANNDEESRKNTDDTQVIYHKVRIGETITQIAARYNVSKKDIVTWNKLSSNIAKVGQRLMIRIPEQSDGSTSSFAGDKRLQGNMPQGNDN